MRLYVLRTGIAAVAAAVALAACGGHGIVPQSAAPGQSFDVLSPAASTTCATKPPQPTWIFKGSCVVSKLPSNGAVFKLAPYMGITITATLPSNTAKGATWVVVDALDKNKDILPYKGKAFPPFKSTTQKTLVYVQSINGSKGDVKFTSGNLVFKVAAKSFPGKMCFLAYLKPNSTFTKFSWKGTPFQSAVKKGAVTFSIPSSLLMALFPKGLLPGPLFLNTSCK